MPETEKIIRVSAVVVRDAEGRVLNVRKRGTRALMLPGGKPEAGEDPRDTAIREFGEELGVDLDPLLLRSVGRFTAPAANEAGHTVVAAVYEHPSVAVDAPCAEIEHLEWVDPLAPQPAHMAPLNVEHVFPALREPHRAPGSLAVFTGSASGASPVYARAAAEFGAACAARGIGLVTGGGRVGLMGVVADAAIGSGGEVVGVIPESLVHGELGHTGLTRLEVVADMHTRKHRMASLVDGFVALPGGPGTLDELFEAFTWLQLGIHTKPVALYDVDGFWQPLLRTFDAMTAAGFMKPDFRDALVVAETPDALFDALAEWRAPRAKWTSPGPGEVAPVPAAAGEVAP